MPKKAIWILILLALAGCKKQPQGRLKVLIGATTIVAPGAPPVEDSIVIIEGKKIRAVGLRKDVPVPQASDRIDLTGEWVVPAAGARIAVGETANMMVLRHAPNGIQPSNPSDVTSHIVAGEWELPH